MPTFARSFKENPKSAASIVAVIALGATVTVAASLMWPDIAIYVAVIAAIAIGAAIVVAEPKTEAAPAKAPAAEAEVSEEEKVAPSTWLSSTAPTPVSPEVRNLRKQCASLKKEVDRLKRLSDGAEEGLAQSDGDGKLVYANAQLLEALDVKKVSEIEKAQGPFAIDDKSVLPFGDVLEHLSANIGKECEFAFERKGKLLSYLGKASELEMHDDDANAETRFEFKNISERERKNIRLEYYANHDAMTGALNRIALTSDLDAAARAAAPDRPLSFIAIDLDDFKPVNDTHGHTAGDKVLKETVKRVKDLLGKRGTFYRTGGDEFVVLCPHCHEDDAVTLAEDLVAAVSEPHTLGDIDVQVGASAGICLMPQDTNSIMELVEAADIALYAAKKHGVDCVVFSQLEDFLYETALTKLGKSSDPADGEAARVLSHYAATHHSDTASH